MKRYYSIFIRFFYAALCALFVFLFPIAGTGQSSCFSLGMPTVSGAQGDTVVIPVLVLDFQDIYSFQFSLSWSKDDLELLPPLIFGANPLFLSNANFNASQPGELKFTFFDQNAQSVTLPNNSVIFNLRFRVKSSQPEFIPIRTQLGQTSLPWEVSAETGELSAALRVGGVYANMAAPSNPPVIDAICSSTTSGNCLNNVGTITTTVSGGVGPLAFLWLGPNGLTSTTKDLTNLIFGMYHLTITDQNGAEVYADVYVASGAWPFSLNGTAQNTSCSGADGCIQLTPTTNQWPVTYTWSAAGLSGQNVCNLTPGMYTVTATDAGGCTSVQTIEVLLENELLADVQAAPANCSNGQLGSAVVLPQNGVPPYDYLWSNNVTDQINSGLMTGQYTVTVTDMAGCTAVREVSVDDTGASNWYLELFSDCPGGGNEGTLLLLSATPNSPAYPVTVEWSNGTTVIVPAPDDTLSVLEMVPSGLYSALVTDSLGCNVFLESALSCFGSTQQDSALLVWPGDADNNNAVNHHDLLYLGLAYGSTGTPRAGATNDWAGQAANDWSQNTTGRVVNFKNMDTNGDGTVNAADTVAIVSNWGRVVDPLADNPFAAPDALPGMGGSGAPAPSMTLAADTLFAGQTTYIPVILGTSDVPADSLHGLAFSLAYNPKVLTPKYFEPASSWFGDPDNGLICVQRHFAGQNRIDVALSRTDGLPAGGFGLIGRMFIIIEDDIFFRKKDLGEPESENDATVTTRMFFRNIRLMRTSNVPVDAAPTESKVTVSQTVGTAQPEQPGIAFSVWPNPASQTVHLATGSEIPLRAVRISDLAGRLCYQSTNQNVASLTVEVQGWTPGVYLIQAQTDFGRTTQMLVIEN